MSEDSVLYSENLIQELTEASQHDSRQYTSYLLVRARQEIKRLSVVAAPKVKALEWVYDGGKVRLDDNLMFGKGYDYDGLEMCRQEAYGVGCNYLIWPDSITSKDFSLYATSDGLYIQSLTEQEAKAAAQSHYEKLILEALV